jgi:hypothetical protein
MKSSFEDVRILVGPHKKSSFEKFGGQLFEVSFPQIAYSSGLKWLYLICWRV